MQISDIRKNKKHLTDIFIDGEFFTSIDTYILSLSGLKIGGNIEKKELDSLIDKSNDYRSYNKAIYLLGFRDYSCKELKDKLKLEYPEESIEKTIEKLKSLKFLDDDRFAQKYVRVLIFEKYFSKKRAKFELIKKGIDKELASNIVEDVDVDVDEREQIKFLISHKYKDAYKDEKIKRRAMAFLQRYGYSFSDIASVLFREE